MLRLGLWPWLGISTVFVGLQVACVLQIAPDPEGPGWFSLPMAMLLVLLLQIAKIGPTMGRLVDLGRAPDDAVLTLVPFINLGLFSSLLRPRPSNDVLARRTAAWQGRTLAPQALARGGRALLGGASVVLPAYGVYGVVVGLAEWGTPTLLGTLLKLPEATRTSIFQGTMAVLVMLGLYLVLQLFKVRTASRASWLPTLLILPVLLVGLALWPAVLTNFGEIGPAAFAYAGWGLGLWVIGGGVLTPLVIALAYDQMEHGSIDVGRTLTWLRPRWLGALVLHGATTTAIWVGLQVLWIPGLVYAMVMAFVVHAALLDPQSRPFRRSARLSRGAWRRIFNVMALGFLAMLVVQLLTLLATEAIVAGIGQSEFVDAEGAYAPGRLLFSWMYAQVYAGAVRMPAVGVGVAAATSGLVWAAVNAGLTWVYRERLAE
jgi:hypothetical protein